MDFSHTWDWMKSHPYLAGGVVAAVVIAVLYMTGWFSRGSRSSTSSDPTMTAYYAAEAASAQSGNQLAIAQDAFASQVAIAQINADVTKSGFDNRASLADTAARVNAQNIAGAQTINWQNVSRDQTINEQNVSRDQTINWQNVSRDQTINWQDINYRLLQGVAANDAHNATLAALTSGGITLPGA